MPKNGIALANIESERVVGVLNSDATRVLGKVKTTRLLYGTMTGTDMAIYELNVTFAQLYKKWRVEALVMADTPAKADTDIEIISGYWKKGFRCSLEKVVPILKEAGWVWRNSLRYSEKGCEIYGGTSGSPILAEGTRDVIAVNNTGNDSGLKCKINNPCEVDADGEVKVIKNRGYGQQTYRIYTCLNSKMRFDFSLPGCRLLAPANKIR